MKMLAPIDKERPELPWDVKQQVEINLKYEGYIKRQMKQVEQFRKLEAKKIPEDLDYEKVGSLRIEARAETGRIQTCLHWSGIQNLRCITGRYICIIGISGTVQKSVRKQRDATC